MSPPSRKKRPKGQDSPTTNEHNDQVHFSAGRHTDVAHEDELVLAADGSKQPLRDTPVSSLATAAVAPASFETIDTDSIPVNTSGHPSAVSSSSQMSTHDAETAAAQRLIRHQSRSQPLYVKHSSQSSRNATSPIMLLAKKNIYQRKAKSLEWSTPIEESKIPQIAPAEANPEQVVTIPVTQFAIFVQHAHRGFSAVLPSDRSQQPTGPTIRPRLSTIYTGKDSRESSPRSDQEVSGDFHVDQTISPTSRSVTSTASTEPSATPMRTSSNIIASPSQNGPESRAVPSSRQSPPPPLVTGTALNHDYTPYGLRRTRRKPTRYRD
uniref:Uncharacterized protein n=1 Tax=Caenorhabditis japonica TaxID=281687 RepID=A0A8R1EBR6_CAEJA